MRVLDEHSHHLLNQPTNKLTITGTIRVISFSTTVIDLPLASSISLSRSTPSRVSVIVRLNSAKWVAALDDETRALLVGLAVAAAVDDDAGLG